MVLPVGMHCAPLRRLVKLGGHGIVSPGLPDLLDGDVWPRSQHSSALDGEQRRIYAPLEVMVGVVSIRRRALKPATAVVFVSEWVVVNFIGVPEDSVHPVDETGRDDGQTNDEEPAPSPEEPRSHGRCEGFTGPCGRNSARSKVRWPADGAVSRFQGCSLTIHPETETAGLRTDTARQVPGRLVSPPAGAYIYSVLVQIPAPDEHPPGSS